MTSPWITWTISATPFAPASLCAKTAFEQAGPRCPSRRR
jgi:hypothetical protein